MVGVGDRTKGLQLPTVQRAGRVQPAGTGHLQSKNFAIGDEQSNVEKIMGPAQLHPQARNPWFEVGGS